MVTWVPSVSDDPESALTLRVPGALGIPSGSSTVVVAVEVATVSAAVPASSGTEAPGTAGGSSNGGGVSTVIPLSDIIGVFLVVVVVCGVCVCMCVSKRSGCDPAVKKGRNGYRGSRKKTLWVLSTDRSESRYA